MPPSVFGKAYDVETKEYRELRWFLCLRGVRADPDVMSAWKPTTFRAVRAWYDQSWPTDAGPDSQRMVNELLVEHGEEPLTNKPKPTAAERKGRYR